ncbi:DNA-directed RNA polymerase III subunit Rpc5 [Chlamydoabsidia padenii]|nr:DNA-directed RNA polymerase III subunit Rpc5 [Chlamydoabsidia padenii]
MPDSPKAIAHAELQGEINSRSPTGTPSSLMNVALHSDLVDAPSVTDMDENDDPVVAEFPVYFSTTLCSKLYLLQYPMRNTPFGPRQGPVAARIKPNAKMVQLDLPLDTRSAYYSTERGEDFAMGMNDKVMKTAYDRRMEEHEDEERFGRNKKQQEDELLDKMTLTSTEVPTQTKYLVGVLHNDELHVTPLSTVIQMRPGFSYLDKIDEKFKAANKRIQDVERQEEKKKVEGTAQTVQVSMKQNEREGNSRRNLYSMAVRNADEETWKHVVYHDETSPEAEAEYSKLYSSELEELKSSMTQSEFLNHISGVKV